MYTRVHLYLEDSQLTSAIGTCKKEAKNLVCEKAINILSTSTAEDIKKVSCGTLITLNFEIRINTCPHAGCKCICLTLNNFQLFCLCAYLTEFLKS